MRSARTSYHLIKVFAVPIKKLQSLLTHTAPSTDVQSVFQWPIAARYLPEIINTGIAVQYSALPLKPHVFIAKMGIFKLTFKQVFENII